MSRSSVLCVVVAFSLCGLLIYSGCDTSPGGGTAGDSSGATAETGTLRVEITDKPYPVDLIKEALITITRVEARRSSDDDDGDGNENGSDNLNSDGDNANDGGGGNDNADADNQNNAGDDNDNADDANDNGDNDGDDSAFVVLFEGERSFDLLDLRNGRTDLLAEAEIPADTYTQLRLVVTKGQVTLGDEEETTFVLTVPSGEQTGIKLNLTFEVSGDEETVLLLDVNLSRAFSPIPGSGVDDPDKIREFHFSPSIAMRLINMLDAGSIEGTVTDPDANPLADVLVTAYDGDEEVAGTVTDENGSYVVGGLPTGNYRLEYFLDGYDEAENADLNVQAGETLDGVDAVLTPSGG